MEKKTLTNTLLRVIVVLAILLVCAISFLGIHKREMNSWKNILPEYQLDKNLSEAKTHIVFEVDNTVEEVEAEHDHDHEANEGTAEIQVDKELSPDATGEATTGASATETTEEEPEVKHVPVNDPAKLNKDNFLKSKEIITHRLANFGLVDTIVSVNEDNGEIYIDALYDTEAVNRIVELTQNSGDIKIIDTETKEVLMPKDMIKIKGITTQESNRSTLALTTSDTPAYDIGVVLEFTKKGQSKLNEISKKYIETMDENGETTQKTVSFTINDEEEYVTYFSPDGQYTQVFIPLSQNISIDDEEEFYAERNSCAVIYSAINSETLPIKYTAVSATILEAPSSKTNIKYIVIFEAAVVLVISIYAIVKKQKAGILATIIELGFIAITLLLIRAATVVLTLSGLVTILLMSLMNFVLLFKLMGKEKIGSQCSEFGKFILKLTPFIATIIVFVLCKDINIQSVGAVGIWATFGLAYTLLMSIILLRTTKKNGDE